jgi:hypothetical protein
MESNKELVMVKRQWIEDVKDESVSTSQPFIDANTIESSLHELMHEHIIPVFIKDNEPVISHSEFINTTYDCVKEIFSNEIINTPSVRVSHPVKGRIPDARNKPAAELQEHEKTLYYERMAFCIELPSVQEEFIDGNILSLVVGGVKAYNLDNLYAKKGTDEHFKVFIGFKNSVCCNLKIWTDGYSSDIRVSSLGQLKACILDLLQRYNAGFHIHQMQQLSNYTLTEQQFANILGKARMYPHLPKALQNKISPLLFGDTQLGAVCKDYYKDDSFCRDNDGNIDLWRLYNLFTGANKSSYIDSFIDKSVNAYHFVEQIRLALEQKQTNWFLN